LKRSFSIWLFFLLCFATPVAVFGIVQWYEKNKSVLPQYGGPQHRMEEFKLRNQQGMEVSLSKWKEKIVVANFFFTHCPVVCPKMMNELKYVKQSIGDDGNVCFVSLTVDPQRDSVGRLKDYAQRFGIPTSGWDLLTGDKKQIYRLARKSFLLVATDGDGGANDFIHSDQLVLIDRKLHIRGFYRGTERQDAEQLLIDIKKLKNEN
jgi:protein SCO1/2